MRRLLQQQDTIVAVTMTNGLTASGRWSVAIVRECPLNDRWGQSPYHTHTSRQTDAALDRDRQANRQTDRQTDGRTERGQYSTAQMPARCRGRRFSCAQTVRRPTHNDTIPPHSSL